MKTVNFMDFGRQQPNCHVLDEGFVLWTIDGNEPLRQICLQATTSVMLVKVLVMGGETQIVWREKVCLLSKGDFANFIDIESLTFQEISPDAQIYVLFFTPAFITSLLKNKPPFPASYVLKIKEWPIYSIPDAVAQCLSKHIEYMIEIFQEKTHLFQQEKLKCSLWMFMMDLSNEYLQLESKRTCPAEAGRKQELFQRFIQLLLAHVREEHSVGWYASQLCVTPQYLNRVIKITSQKTASDYIFTTLTGAILEDLENTNKPIVQIAEEFRFPDQSTFTKFFKRQTGKTPSEHRIAITSTFHPIEP